MDLKPLRSTISFQQAENDQILQKKQEMAMEFERMFAKHLVEEMTKGTFKMDDKAIGASSFGLYREQITDSLANEIANQRKLGMADLVMKHWKIKE